MRFFYFFSLREIIEIILEVFTKKNRSFLIKIFKFLGWILLFWELLRFLSDTLLVNRLMDSLELGVWYLFSAVLLVVFWDSNLSRDGLVCSKT